MNSLFNNKSFVDIEFEDIKSLVENGTPESLILDYKGDVLQTNLKAKELGKDVSVLVQR